MTYAQSVQGGSGATPAGGGGGGVVGGEPWPGPKHVLVTVPAGYKPDDDLFFNSPGGGCSVRLPHGIKEQAKPNSMHSLLQCQKCTMK